jgi:hypothetical protein
MSSIASFSPRDSARAAASAVVAADKRHVAATPLDPKLDTAHRRFTGRDARLRAFNSVCDGVADQVKKGVAQDQQDVSI